MQHIGSVIRKKRRRVFLSQAELSKKTNIPQTTISWWELGHGCPNFYQCIRIADALGTSLDEMREEYLKQEKVDRTNF